MTRDARTQAIWDLGGFERGRGLEIGPLHRVCVTREEADVRYVDVVDRAGLVAHYGPDPAVDTDLIPEIDFPLILDGRTRTLAEAAGRDAPYDWVVASHVVEHVPDLIGWLEEVAELVVDGGSLVLVVPDKRYCFDVHRSTTTVGAMLQAHDDRDSRPSVRAVYDHFREAAKVDTRALWRGGHPEVEDADPKRDMALGHVARTREGTYVDCHVWLFTPELFLSQLHDLRLAGVSEWYVDVVEPTPTNDLEFRVRLRRLPRERGVDIELPDEVLAADQRPHWARADGTVSEVTLLRRRLREQRREIKALKASTTWRVGRVVVAPLGAARRLVRRS